MNTFNFLYYTKNCNSLNEFTLKHLRQEIRNHPYMQIARALYLKNLLILNKPEFEEELKSNVPFITNRAFLFELLFDRNLLEDLEEQSTAEIYPDPIDSHNSQSTQNKTTTENDNPETSVPDNSSGNNNPATLSPSVKRIFSESMQSNIADLIHAQVGDTDDDTFLEREIRLNTIQLNVEKEYACSLDIIYTENDSLIFDFDASKEAESETITEDERRIGHVVSDAWRMFNRSYKPKESQDETPTGKLTTSENAEEIEEAIESFELLLDENDTPKEKQPQAEGMSFTEWLDMINTSTSPSQVPDKTSEEENELAIGTSEESDTDQEDLIDTFLRLSPAIKPVKPEDHVQEDISVASVEENEDYLTDTLAKIYIKQERFEKAISVYKKLILKYPEKNIYFANQINEIEKKLDN